MKRNMFAAIFLCLTMGCGVESRVASDSTERVSTSSDEISSLSNQSCLAQCLQDCGAVCGGLGTGKPACIAECRAENQECRDFCAGQ
jgi:hypothetical protein